MIVAVSKGRRNATCYGKGYGRRNGSKQSVWVAYAQRVVGWVTCDPPCVKGNHGAPLQGVHYEPGRDSSAS
ncbi:hypothetical protein AWZ03_003221 [Drosophila navojoa]|uniref:Uncharacterized protein n=1 Tax=Drosophila navojoa TaxID=7232 RepID=A0A484BN69_DRONA|nr:hypothetical protein AWZ03_003221 [Drosophila navojoa]